MKQLNKILLPTDLSEHSRRAMLYGCDLAIEVKAELVVLHVASELSAWEFYSDDALYAAMHNGRVWPLDRIQSEATLDLNHFLEPHLATLKQLCRASKRVVLGPVAPQIIWVAEKEKADLVIMSPRRSRGLRHWIGGSITDRVTRQSPCPVLSVTPPLPSQPWRKKLVPQFFGWPRHSAASF
jgi:nucleotide-binding universal stress UspA family protein